MSAQIKILELAERGRKATAERVAREVNHPPEPPPLGVIERYRRDNPPGSIDRGPVCPQCDCAATKVAKHIECSHCGRVSEQVAGGLWMVIGQCRLANGDWPTRHDAYARRGGK